MSDSPTSRSLALLRGAGWYADKVEQRLPIPGAFVTKDWCGFGDILAVNENLGILLVQTTTNANAAARMRKIEKNPTALAVLRAWLAIGGLFVVHAWATRGAAGERKLWSCRMIYAERVTDCELGLRWREGGVER